MKLVILSNEAATPGVRFLGEEAKVDALLGQLQETGAHLTVISDVPVDLGGRDGLSISKIGFAGGSLSNREWRMRSVIAAASGETGVLGWQDPAWAVIEAVAASTSVVIAGGGHLTSIWPERVYEAATIGALARVFNKPLIVTGQSIGPSLTERDGQLVAELLGSALIVGARESATQTLVSELGVEPWRVRRTVDDAAFLGLGSDSSPASDGGYVLATFAPSTGSVSSDEFAAAAAELLDHVAATTKLRVLLLAHAATTSTTPGTAAAAEPAPTDDAFHALIRARSTSGRIELTNASTAADAAALARAAELVISTRYQPVVFATAGGVPTLGIAIDSDTDSKIAGALENFGQGESLVPALALFTGHAALAVDDVWKRRRAIRTAGTRAAATRRRDQESWWAGVRSSLGGTLAEPSEWTTIEAVSYLDPELSARLRTLRGWMLADSSRTTGANIVARVLSERVADLEQETAVAEARAGAAIAELQAAQARAQDAEDALAATQELSAKVNDRAFAKKLARQVPLQQTNDVLELQATRTFRYTARLRNAYSLYLRYLRVTRR